MIAAALATAAVVVLVGAYLAGVNGLFSGSTGNAAAPSISSPASGSAHASTGSSGSAGTGSAASSASTPSIYDCPTGAAAAMWGCLTQAKVNDGKIDLTYTENFQLSAVQDANHFHFHLWLANPGPNGTIVPAEDLMQMVPNPGSWFIIYSSNVTVIDAKTEQGGTKLGLQTSKYSLLCVRVADGLHGLVPDKSGGLHTGNCVKLT